MPTWREARSLTLLLATINAAAPHRSKASDGSIGDAAHAARASDHNPWVIDANGVGVVRARDFTHDPIGGLNCDRLALDLAGLLGGHPALGKGSYIIWQRRIISTERLSEGWRTYSGSNPHEKHLHLSVGYANYDSPTPWPVLVPKPRRTPDADAIYETATEKVQNAKGDRLTYWRRIRRAARNLSNKY